MNQGGADVQQWEAAGLYDPEAGPGFEIFRSVGRHDLRGFAEPVELYALERA